MAAESSRVVLGLRGMTKRFGEVVACDGVDLDLRAGEIHGILGENGAGKSTLMRMAIGLVVPDAGSISIDGEPCRIEDPLEAARQGIGMVHQEFSLVDALTVWENVAIGEQGSLDPAATRSRVLEIAERYGLGVDPDSRVGSLAAGGRQRVEIIKCLRHEPRIIILDEPTAVLTPAESEHLFAVLREGVRREGWAVALVSHKLDEVMAATDRVTVMRDGEVVERAVTSDADARSLARSMVGREVTVRTAAASIGASAEGRPSSGGSHQDDSPVLEVRGARARAEGGSAGLDGLSLEVRRGEVVGVAGVEGNGQSLLTRVLESLVRLDGGEVLVEGRRVPTGRAGAMLRAGVSVIPAGHPQSGFIPEMTVAENLVLSSLGGYARKGILSRERIHSRAAELIEEFGIRCPSPSTPAAHLSGGNRRRVVLARALSVAPKLLVAHQPTRGLDVGGIEYIGERIAAAAEDGIGVLLLSTDLGEIAALADRIAVIYRGRIIGEMARDEVDMERLGLLIGGSKAEEDAV